MRSGGGVSAAVAAEGQERQREEGRKRRVEDRTRGGRPGERRCEAEARAVEGEGRLGGKGRLKSGGVSSGKRRAREGGSGCEWLR